LNYEDNLENSMFTKPILSYNNNLSFTTRP